MTSQIINHSSDRFTIEQFSYTRMAPWELQLKKDCQLAINQAADLASNQAQLEAIAKATWKKNAFVSKRQIGSVQNRPDLKIWCITVYNDKRILLTVTESIVAKVKENKPLLAETA